MLFFFFFQAEDGIRDLIVTGVQTCALPISRGYTTEVPVPVLFHPACQRHNPGPGHPERPERIVAVLDALRAADMASCLDWCEALPASRTALERVHSARYLDGLERVAGQGGGVLDADTVMSADSWNAAVAAAGVAIGAVERAIVAGPALPAAPPPRPPPPPPPPAGVV